jgi:hypothetical protein
MNLLKSIGTLGLAAGVLLAADLRLASAQTTSEGLTITPVSDAALTAPRKNIQGKVISILGRELTLEVNGRNMRFVVDENTDVLARGAGRATRKAGGGVPITDLVHSGDLVRVSYRESGGSMRVFEVQIRGRSTIAAR